MKPVRAVFILVAAAVAGISAPAQADLDCSSATTSAIAEADGQVLVLPAFRGNWTEICNLNQTWHNITPATCFAWFSTVNGSIMYNKQVAYYYTGSVSFTCSTIPTYADSPAPAYVRLF